MTSDRIKLDPLLNQLVRFKLDELGETKEAVICAFDEHGYWVEGGSLAQYLQRASTGAEVSSEIQFVEYKRIYWLQRV